MRSLAYLFIPSSSLIWLLIIDRLDTLFISLSRFCACGAGTLADRLNAVSILEYPLIKLSPNQWIFYGEIDSLSHILRELRHNHWM